MSKNNINITRHAIVRYFNRIACSYIVTDKAYDIWKKEHEKEIKQAEENIKELLDHEDTIYITEGNYNTHRKAAYYLNKKHLIIFVVAENKVITMYKVDYGLDTLGNAEMLEVLLKNLSRVYMEEEEYNKLKDDELKRIKSKEDILNAEHEEIKAKERIIIVEKQGWQMKRKSIENKGDEIKARIATLREKIVKSINALGE